jgi:hypothetical protein
VLGIGEGVGKAGRRRLTISELDGLVDANEPDLL